MRLVSFSLSLSLCALAGGLGCLDADPTDDPIDDPAAPGVRVLATVELPDDVQVEFGVMPTGGITTMEYAPVKAPSPMNYYARRYQATPLELFTALAPDREAPPELVAAHATQVIAEHRADAEPRALPTLEEVAASSGADFHWYYAADCSLAEDGGWFDDFWDTYNWGWHWYWRTTEGSRHSPGIASKDLQIHLCNDASSSTKNLAVMKSGSSLPGTQACTTGGNWFYVYSGNVAPQYRRQFRVTNDSVPCTYEAIGQPAVGSPGHPWWDLGVTKP